MADRNMQSFAADADRLKFAMKAAGIGVWELDVTTDKVIWDERCRELFGIARGNDIPYEAAIQFIHPEDKRYVDQAVQGALRGENGGAYNAIYRTIGADDGFLRWVNFSGNAYFDESGQLTRFGGIGLDVTETHNVQNQVEESQGLLLTALEQSPVAIATIARDKLTFTSANAFYGVLVGRKPSDIIGKPLLEALPELVGKGFEGLLNAVLATGVAYSATELAVELMRGGQKETVFVNFMYQPLRDADGTAHSVLVVATDVTQQAADRRQLEQSEKRFRTLIEEAPVATCLYVGRELRVEFANDLMIEIWGKGSNVLGMMLAEVLPELDGQPFLEILDGVFTKGETFSGTGVPADIVKHGVRGTWYYDFTYKPLRNASGQVYAILQMALDVTERVLSRKRLEEAETRLRTAVDLAELATWSINLTNNQVTYSSRLQEWTGLPEHILRMAAPPPVHERDRERIAGALLAATAPGSTGLFDEVYTIVHAATGQQRIIHTVGQAEFDPTGKAVLIAGTSQDVTMQQQMQLALENEVRARTEELKTSNEALEDTNTRLQHSNEELTQYAYVASHDLQEPLRKIQVFSGLLKQDAGISEKGVDLLEKISASSDRMRLLISDLLNFSRLLNSDEKFQPVDLGEIMSKIILDFELIIAEKSAVFQLDTLPTVEAVGLQMNQLLYNLISNSLKFTRPDASPEIAVTCRILSDAEVRRHIHTPIPAAAYHEICIKDNGIGFEQQHAGQIFDVFKRLHGRDIYPGSGIGLALCRRIVVNHGGALYAESTLGQGASFWLILPQRQVAHNRLESNLVESAGKSE